MAKTILLADDSITIQKVVELTFSDGDYNVVAVSNGSRAIERLAEVRPDVILSDIIMPEKNGYEVCEYIKSHPEYRHVPVILLTGTFEPFDPDRAEKAGCDAVVTKPFESQSLIHKVEELIEQSRSAAPPPPAAQPEEEVWRSAPEPEPAADTGVWGGAEEAEPPEAPSIWETSEPAEGEGTGGEESPAGTTGADSPFWAADEFPPPSADEPRSDSDAQAWSPEESSPSPFGGHDATSFGGAEQESESPEPLQTEDAFGQTRDEGFPPMPFDDLDSSAPGDPLAGQVPGGDAREESAFGSEETTAQPWDAPAWETSDESAAADEAPLSGEGTPDESPGADQQPLQDEEGATRVVPMMSPDEIRRIREQETAAAEQSDAQADTGAGAEAEESPFGGGDAFGAPVGFDYSEPMPESSEEQRTEDAGDEEKFELPQAGDFSGAFPQEEQSAGEASLESSPFETPAAPFEDGTPQFGAAGFDESASPFGEPEERREEESPQGDSAAGSEVQEQPETGAGFDEQTWASATEPTYEEPQQETAGSETEEERAAASPWIGSEPAAATPAAAEPRQFELSDEQIERIARRVVEMLSDDSVRKIAWEVIPDMAEMVVRERLRELEAEDA